MLTYEPRTGVVLAGTLDGFVDLLIERCGTYNNGGYNFQDVFFTTCAEFTNPDELFQKFANRFNDVQNPEIRSNIITVITDWLQLGYFSPSHELMGRMRRFCRDAIEYVVFSNNQLTQSLRGLENLIGAEIQKPFMAPTNFLEPSGPSFRSPIVEPFDLAIGLTLLEGANFSCFRAATYIPHLNQPSPDDVIGRICETNERITAWVSLSILEDDHLNRRIENMRYFIKTAVECQRLRNISSTVAIARALYSSNLRNLQETRNGLSCDKKRKLFRLTKLANGVGYRKAIRKAHQQGSCVPWLAFHLEELERISKAERKLVETEGYRLINFRRSNAFMDCLREVEQYSPPDMSDLRRKGQLSYIQGQLRSINMDEINAQLLARSVHLVGKEAELRNNRIRRLGFS